MFRNVVTIAMLLTGTVIADEIRIKIDAAEEYDVKTLSKQLNEKGKRFGLSFINTSDDYEYKIAPGNNRIHSGTQAVLSAMAFAKMQASAAILTKDCRLIFATMREGHYGNGLNAYASLATEISKRLSAYRENPAQSPNGQETTSGNEFPVDISGRPPLAPGTKMIKVMALLSKLASGVNWTGCCQTT